MCGICGYLSPAGTPEAAEIVENMAELIAHRGPDGRDRWSSNDGRVVLGHTRLKVIDPSDQGSQPMTDGENLVISYNGEIYNFRELRSELESCGHRFKSRTDTEVLLYAYKQWGAECLDKIEGMFAFAVYDTSRQTLLLARDPFGIKPLYYVYQPDRLFSFASESKAFLAIPGLQASIRRDLLPEYFTFRSVIGHETLLAPIQTVLPGQFLEFNLNEFSVRKVCYWRMEIAAEINSTATKRAREFLSKLSSTVRAQLVSDVPVGTQLSGGLDSSLVTALARKEHTTPLKAFNIRVDAPEADEGPWAQMAARHLGIELVSEPLTAKTFFGLLPKLTWHLDEPIAHPSSIGIYLLAKTAREQVTVLLSGEGADEIFGGYTRYRHLRLFDRIHRLGLLGYWLLKAYPGRKGRAFVDRAIRHYWESANCLTAQGFEYLDGSLAEKLLGRSYRACEFPARRLCAECGMHDRIGVSQLYDIRTYLPGVLNRQDKMSMAASIESRVPFLDRNLARWGLSLPLSDRLGRLRGKDVVKRSAMGLLPRKLVLRPKCGFGVPLEKWLGLKEAEPMWDVTVSNSTIPDGIVNCNALRALADRRHTLSHIEAEAVWIVMTFAVWVEEYVKRFAARGASVA